MEKIQNTLQFTREPSAVMLGKFDGFHKGHQAVYESMRRACRDAKPALQLGMVTFDFRMQQGDEQRNQLFTYEEREWLARALGFDWMALLPFTDALRTQSPEEFFYEILLKQCNAKAIFVGEDYRFGYRRMGDVDFLQRYCEKEGIALTTIPEQCYDNEKISSTKLRELLLSDDMETIRELLGFPYFVHGRVLHGKQIGRTIGFPTANLSVSSQKLLPGFGVYHSLCIIENRWEEPFWGITNVGTNPTVTGEDQPITVETNLAFLDEDIYDREMTVFFLKKTRPQFRFDSLSALKKQLTEDKERLYNEHKHYRSVYEEGKRLFFG